MRALFLISAGLVALVFVAYLAGLRIFVIKPIGAIPDGVTAIVMGPSGLNFIDSPDAFCQRTTGNVTLLCRGTTAAMVASRGTILARLPYSSFLDDLAGSPETTR